MAQITDYTTLKDNAAGWLTRASDTDFTTDVPTMIQLAEQRLRRDPRLRKLQYRGAFTISANGDSLPSDFKSLDSWVYLGESLYGPIETVGFDKLAELRGRFGPTGQPRYATIIDGSTVQYAPGPDATYTSYMTYNRKITALSSSNTSNWLLADHPDIYLFATLAEAEPWLRDDERAALWESKLENAIAGALLEYQDKHFSGNLVMQRNRMGV